MKTAKICTKCKQEKELSEFSIRNIKRQYYTSQCKNCDRLYRQENAEAIRIKKKIYNDKNKEKIAIQVKKYREANRETDLKRKRNYREKNKEKIRASSKEYRRNNSDKIKEYRDKNKERLKEYDKTYSSIYAEKNKQSIAKKRQEYYINNKDIINKRNSIYKSTERGKLVARLSRQKRRANLKNGNICINEINELVKNTNNCYWCNTKLNKKEKAGFHLDHYVALSKGGTHTIDNIVISCPDCNLKKNAKDPYEFALTKGKLL